MLQAPPMVNEEPELPLQCTRCGSIGARLKISSTTVITVKCGGCAHGWSVDVVTLSADGRKQLAAAILAARTV